MSSLIELAVSLDIHKQLQMLDRSKPVRLVASVDSPLVNECFNQYPSRCTEPGFEAEYSFTLVHDLLKLDVEWVRVDSYTEIEEALDNGTADMVASSFFVDQSYIEKWGYSPPYIWDGTALLVKETIVDTSESLLLIRQFAYDLWATMMIGTLIILVIERISEGVFKRHALAGTTSLSGLIKLVAHAFRAKFLYGMWFVFITIMLNFYGNLMAVDLLHSSKTRKIPFGSMDELGKMLLRKECQLAIYDAYSDSAEFFGTIINPSRHNRSWAADFREAYKINKPIFASSREELASLILNSTCTVGLDWLTIKEYFISRWCDIRMVIYPEEYVMFYQYTFYSTRIDLREAVNTVIDSVAFQSFPDILSNKYYFNGYMPNCVNIEQAQVVPVTVAQMQDAFYVLLLGLVTALIFVVYQRYKLNTSSFVKHLTNNVCCRSNTSFYNIQRKLSV